ncbi:hypothetical protein [Lutibacter sp.]|uniref:hypothetical protein n=1 Tax=Lutibacter sp. TaxID=1925666 RepID=UPI001A22065B|nr:hypothetical protein [Lutibacter sp.]MBI9039913.1 hypothetical protein [Lutibacter sp.]
MKNLKYIIGIALLTLVIIAGCKEDTYEFGDLIAPSNLVINADIVGMSDSNPNGDGSGEVVITVNADDAITYHIGFNKIDDFAPVNYKVLASGTINQKFTDPGVNTYRISMIAFGPGGVASNLTKDITVRSDYVPDPEVVTAITNDNSKTWVVNKDVPAHFGVGPWGEKSPIWWTAGVDEKLTAAPCFYSTTFTFIKNANGTFKLTVDASADGAFTKTGALANIPGIPASGDEGCYSEYSGGSSSFNFVPSSSGIAVDATYPSTQIAIKLATNEAYIGYGAVQSEYEILEATSDYLYLRVQGTETGNGWWIKLKPVQ